MLTREELCTLPFLDLGEHQAKIVYMVGVHNFEVGTVYPQSLQKAMKTFEVGVIGGVMPVVRLSIEGKNGGEHVAECLAGYPIGTVFVVREPFVRTGTSLVKYRTAVGHTDWHDSGGYQWSSKSYTAGNTDADFLPATQMHATEARFVATLLMKYHGSAVFIVEGTKRL